jgi:hypothetical protein
MLTAPPPTPTTVHQQSLKSSVKNFSHFGDVIFQRPSSLAVRILSTEISRADKLIFLDCDRWACTELPAGLSWTEGGAIASLPGSYLTTQHDEHGSRDQPEGAPPQDVVQPRILQVAGQTRIVDEQENEYENDRQ